jgi:hypothetical protein
MNGEVKSISTSSSIIFILVIDTKVHEQLELVHKLWLMEQVFELI